MPDHAAVIGMERGAAMAGEGRRAKTGWAGVAAIAALALAGCGDGGVAGPERSEEHTSELQSLMRISYAVFCLKKKKHTRYNSIVLIYRTIIRTPITLSKQ